MERRLQQTINHLMPDGVIDVAPQEVAATGGAGLTTHILNTMSGIPAAGVPVTVEALKDNDWCTISNHTTNDNGRATLHGSILTPGTYRLSFDTATYFSAVGQTVFFPCVQVTFVASGSQPYHIPLLLSPFGFSTYRGS